MYKITVGVDGMMCGMCESHVNDAIRKDFKIKKVNSSHSKGITEIICEEQLNEEAISKCIGETGYKVTSYDCQPYEKKGFSLFKK